MEVREIDRVPFCKGRENLQTSIWLLFGPCVVDFLTRQSERKYFEQLCLGEKGPEKVGVKKVSSFSRIFDVLIRMLHQRVNRIDYWHPSTHGRLEA